MRHAFIRFLIWLILPTYHLAKNPERSGKGNTLKQGPVTNPAATE